MCNIIYKGIYLKDKSCKTKHLNISLNKEVW